jgi:hypothetical protein
VPERDPQPPPEKDPDPQEPKRRDPPPREPPRREPPKKQPPQRDPEPREPRPPTKMSAMRARSPPLVILRQWASAMR